jgi:hypothetical protein
MSRRNSIPFSAIDTTRAESLMTSWSARLCSAEGSLKIVCKVVTTGIRRFRSTVSTRRPHGPPKFRIRAAGRGHPRWLDSKSRPPAYTRRYLAQDFETHLRRIIVSFRAIGYRDNRTLETRVLCGDRFAQVRREGGDSALPRDIIRQKSDLFNVTWQIHKSTLEDRLTLAFSVGYLNWSIKARRKEFLHWARPALQSISRTSPSTRSLHPRPFHCGQASLESDRGRASFRSAGEAICGFPDVAKYGK